MNAPFLKKAAQDNWYLLLALVAILICLSVFAFRGKPDVSAETRSTSRPSDVHAELLAQVGDLGQNPERLTVQARARQLIAEHEQKFDADPKSADAPAYLSAMGNLYRQKLSDYEQAASCFERLINEYPDDPSVRDSYLQLLVCYERLGDQENRRRVLRQLMEKYPAESQEHQFAAHELGIVE